MPLEDKERWLCLYPGIGDFCSYRLKISEYFQQLYLNLKELALKVIWTKRTMSSDIVWLSIMYLLYVQYECISVDPAHSATFAAAPVRSSQTFCVSFNVAFDSACQFGIHSGSRQQRPGIRLSFVHVPILYYASTTTPFYGPNHNPSC